MNRSSCLSVLIVGLSLTTTSAVFAAPPASSRPTKQVALNAQQTDSASSSDPTAAPPPAPAPAEPSSAEGTPAVTLGTTTPPAADAPSASTAEPTAKPKPRPFAGSSLFIQQSMTTNTIFQGQTQYSDPTVESALYISPRYAINDAFQLRGRLVVSYEETNSDETVTKHEPTLSDLGLQLFYRKIPEVLGIKPALALNVGLPTSKASQARTLLFTPGATLQLSKGFEHFLGGEAMVLANVGYSHPIYQSRNPVVSDDRPYSLSCVGGGNCADSLSGTMNASDSISYLALFAPEWGKWNPGFLYMGVSQWAYRPKDVTNPVDGTPVTRPVGTDRTNFRQTHYVSAWLDYNFNSWITGEVGFWNSVSGIGESGQRSNIIFDRYQDTRVYLGASIQLDNLVKELQGGDKGDGGIVRAKNTKTPMFNF